VAKRPPIARRATVSARIQTFGQAAAVSARTTGIKAQKAESPRPFTDLATKDHYRRYDTAAQARIALALKEPRVIAVANFHNIGTGSELHVLGRFLQLHYVFEHELFFQEATLRDFRRNRPFVGDIAIRPQGQGMTVLPVDGQEFHARTFEEQFDAIRRNKALEFLGRVVVIPDTVCYRAQDLDSYLNAHQVR
jgi:hypothetical protein